MTDTTADTAAGTLADTTQLADETAARAPREKTRHVVDRAENLPLGSRRIVQVGKLSIGVLNIDDRYHALLNKCPHHGAPLCEGVVRGTMADTAPHEYSYGRHNEFITCPWHGYEFALESGRPLLDIGLRVPVFTVAVEDGDVVLYV
ncbi:MAG TPA: Rieske 2Fe-2S domain-containing protein [Pseudonocardia sp.]